MYYCIVLWILYDCIDIYITFIYPLVCSFGETRDRSTTYHPWSKTRYIGQIRQITRYYPINQSYILPYPPLESILVFLIIINYVRHLPVDYAKDERSIQLLRPHTWKSMVFGWPGAIGATTVIIGIAATLLLYSKKR